MSDPYERINNILQIAATSNLLPIPVAQLFLEVGAEILAARKDIEAQWGQLQNYKERCDMDKANLQKQIDKLKGIHGA